MTLKSDIAVKALYDWLAVQPGLPPDPTLNDPLLMSFTPSGSEGIGWRLDVSDGPIDELAVELGDTAPIWELGVIADVMLSVEGLPGDARDMVLQNSAQALAVALFPDGRGLVIPGAFEDLRTGGRIERGHILPEPQGRLPIETLEIRVSLLVAAQTPFG